MSKDSNDLMWAKAVETFNSGDKDGALFLLKRLAEEGSHAAYVEIANIYDLGFGGHKSDRLAIEWYLKSVELTGDIFAHLGLARIYLRKNRSTYDPSLAKYHLEVLEQYNEHPGALFCLGMIHEQGLSVVPDPSLALEYYRRSASKSHLMGALRIVELDLTTKEVTWKNMFRFIAIQIKIMVVRFKDDQDPRLELFGLGDEWS